MKNTINFLSIILSGLCITPAARGQVLYVQPGGSLVATGNATLTLRGCNLENNGVVDLAEATLIVTGAGTAEIRSASEITVSELTVNKPAGTVLLGTGLEVQNHLNMQQGMLDLNQHDIHLAPGATVEGEHESSRITGLSGGTIYTEATLSQPGSANPGKLGMTITAAAHLGTVTIRRVHQAQKTANDTESITRYFDIQTTGTNPQASLEFHYFDAELNGQAENNLRFLKSANNGISWSQLAVDALDATLNRASLSNTALPFRWTLGPVPAGDSTTLTTTGQTAVSTVETKSVLKAWPVPASGFVYLQAEGIAGNTSAEIFNSGGQLIRRLAIQPGQIQVLDGLIPGVYVVRLGNHRNAQATIIIQ